MKKDRFFRRYRRLIELFERHKSLSFEELKRFFDEIDQKIPLEDQLMPNGYNIRTFQRDKLELESLFGVRIISKKKAYYLERDRKDKLLDDLLDRFDLIHLRQIYSKAADALQTEGRKAEGSDQIPIIIKAINDRRSIAFRYHYFDGREPEDKQVSPFLLREYRLRWYLLAQPAETQGLKLYGLDRIQQLQILEQESEDAAENPFEYFRHSIGIMRNEGPPEIIVIETDTQQAHYFDSQPLHSSQQKIEVNEAQDQVFYTYQLHVTYDLLLEFMQFGSRLKVHQPQTLKEQLKRMHAQAAG